MAYGKSGGAVVKALNRAIERFCHTHRKFGIPRLMLYVVIISAAFYIVALAGGGQIYSFLEFDVGLIFRGQIWRLISWIFLPVNYNIFWVVIALSFYYFIASSLEREWGTPKFTLYYFSGVLLNIIYGFVMTYLTGGFGFINPNFLNLSMFFAFAVYYPDCIIRIFLIIPVKAKWIALANAAFFVLSIIFNLVRGQFVLALLPLVALLNFFVFCGYELMAYIRPLKARASPKTISFKRAARKVKRDFEAVPYRHKCEVCGKTDTDSPGLEFRYCSRCNGYHCFCIEHISKHTHH